MPFKKRKKSAARRLVGVGMTKSLVYPAADFRRGASGLNKDIAHLNMVSILHGLSVPNMRVAVFCTSLIRGRAVTSDEFPRNRWAGT